MRIRMAANGALSESLTDRDFFEFWQTRCDGEGRAHIASQPRLHKHWASVRSCPWTRIVAFLFLHVRSVLCRSQDLHTVISRHLMTEWPTYESSREVALGCEHRGPGEKPCVYSCCAAESTTKGTLQRSPARMAFDGICVPFMPCSDSRPGPRVQRQRQIAIELASRIDSLSGSALRPAELLYREHYEPFGSVASAVTTLLRVVLQLQCTLTTRHTAAAVAPRTLPRYSSSL